MSIYTEEEQLEIENKEKYEALRVKLLKEYKSYEEDLDYADDEFEEELITKKRETLASQIKKLVTKLKEITILEQKA